MSALGALIRELVANEGPIGLGRYMALALGHPTLGYYATRDPLGAAGDFTTAPEISQMFGELLGAWAASAWDAMGRPDPVRLVELGPGRGTLMADALRAAAALPPFRAALDIHLVETSPTLAAIQRRTLPGVAVTWHPGVAEVPPGPLIVLANEFLDALPIRQFVRRESGWHERLVGLDGDGRLRFGLAAEPDRSVAASGAHGAVLEVGEAALAVAAGLARRVVRDGGAALLVDYGHVVSGRGDTLQAVSRHAFADPLEEPGLRDITAHVDFAALARTARAAGAAVYGPANQGLFLEALGIRARAERLSRAASPEGAAGIAAALYRLTAPGDGTAGGGMGELFKVMAIAAPGLPPLPGLPLSRAAVPQENPC